MKSSLFFRTVATNGSLTEETFRQTTTWVFASTTSNRSIVILLVLPMSSLASFPFLVKGGKGHTIIFRPIIHPDHAIHKYPIPFLA